MSRRRHNIMLYCQREALLRITRFILHNVSEGPIYRVHAVQSKREAAALLAGSRRGSFEAAVIIHADKTDAAVWVAAEAWRYGVPSIFLTDGLGMKDVYKNVKANIACPHNTPVSYWLPHVRQLMPMRAKYGTKTAFGRPLGPMVQLPGRFEVRL